MSTPAVECPRCGYDLRGVTAAWSDRCPVQGACAECGLAFDWRDLLNPALQMPPWCVEAKRPWHAWARQVGGTLVHALRPGRYWSSITMVHPIRRARLVLFALSLGAVVLATVHVSAAVMATVDHRNNVKWRARSATSSTEVFLHCLCLPLSTRPVARYTVVPRSGRTFTFGGGAPIQYWAVIVGHAWPVLLLATVTPLTTALAFTALPWSRRRAKVRPRHVGRVALHATVVPFLALMIAAAGSLASVVASRPFIRPQLLHYVAAAALVVGTLAWWHAAVRRYLRMEHPWAVAAAATVIGLLAPISIFGIAWYVLDGR